MYTIQRENDNVRVLNLRITIQCKKCFKTWAKYVYADKEMPLGWDYCEKCNKEQEKLDEQTIDSIFK